MNAITSPADQRIDDLICAYREALLRRARTSAYVVAQVRSISRLCKTLNIESVANLAQVRTEDQLRSLSRHPFTTPSRTATAKRFGAWLVDVGVMDMNPFKCWRTSRRIAPPPLPQPRVLSVAEFWQTMRHLEAAAPVTRGGLTPLQRRLLYWSAVTTGLRATELLRLRREDCNFDSEPATVTLPQSKNSRSSPLPVPADLGVHLRGYCESLEPRERLFPLAVGTHWLRPLLLRDLAAAGVDLSSGQISFHTLRATAISWWLTVHKFSLLEVAALARIRTLALVARHFQRLAPPEVPPL